MKNVTLFSVLMVFTTVTQVFGGEAQVVEGEVQVVGAELAARIKRNTALGVAACTFAGILIGLDVEAELPVRLVLGTTVVGVLARLTTEYRKEVGLQMGHEYSKTELLKGFLQDGGLNAIGHSLGYGITRKVLNIVIHNNLI